MDVVIAVFNALPNKQCASDPLPTSSLKGNVDLLALFLVELFNRSLSMGYIPTALREAYITPILNKTAELSQRRPRNAPTIWVP